MTEFLHDVFQYPFLQYAVLAGILSSLACGIVGTYVVTRRMSYIAGALSHCMLAGMGIACYLQRVHGISGASPLLGALLSALVAALIIGLVTLYATERHDTVLGAVWAVGMAIGISFIVATPGYNEEVMSYLFGDILMVSSEDLWLMLCLDILVVLASVVFYNKLLVLCFNEELACLRGLRVEFYHFLLLLLTALTVTLLVQVVGIVMVIALLTLPAAIASHLVSRLWQVMLLAVVLSVFFTLGGLGISYGPELPAGATIIELAGLTYLLSLAGSALKRMIMRQRMSSRLS